MAAPQLPFIFLISRQGTRETGLPEKAPPPLPSPPPNQKERAKSDNNSISTSLCASLFNYLCIFHFYVSRIRRLILGRD